MKQVAYRVDPDFSKYIGMTDADGHLPDLGITGYVTHQATDFLDYAQYCAMNEVQLSALHDLIMDVPTFHHLSSTAIAFWPKTPCWKCKCVFSPHSYIAKNVLMCEDFEEENAIGENGKERIGIFHPFIKYGGIGDKLGFMPYTCEYMDRILLGVWKSIEIDKRLREFLDSKPARLNYEESKQYGGKYWALTCPDCNALQGEFFLKKANKDDGDKPMSTRPQLVVIPKLNGEDTFGGKVVSRLVTVQVE